MFKSIRLCRKLLHIWIKIKNLHKQCIQRKLIKCCKQNVIEIVQAVVLNTTLFTIDCIFKIKFLLESSNIDVSQY